MGRPLAEVFLCTTLKSCDHTETFEQLQLSALPITLETLFLLLELFSPLTPFDSIITTPPSPSTMASFANRPFSTVDHATVPTNCHRGTVHQFVARQLVMVYLHHPITPSVIEDHWAAKTGPSRASQSYIISMDNGLDVPDLQTPAPVPVAVPVTTREQPATTVEPPVVNVWYLQKFGAQHYYEQEVPEPARRQVARKQEVQKPARSAQFPLRNARDQRYVTHRPFSLPSAAIQAHLGEHEVLKPAPSSFLAPVAAQQQVYDQSAHTLQTEVYSDLDLEKFLSQPLSEAEMEFNASSQNVAPLPLAGLATATREQQTPATPESRKKVLIDLTEEEDEEDWVLVELTSDDIKEEKKAGNKKFFALKKFLSRVLYGKALKWYSTFLAAPTHHQRAYYDEYWWKSDQAALEDISHVSHVFGDFATTRLFSLKYRALVKHRPLVSDDNGGQRQMTLDEINVLISTEASEYRRQITAPDPEPATSKRKCSTTKELQSEKPAKKQKARKPKKLPTPPLEDPDEDAPGEDDDEYLVASQAPSTPALGSTKLDSELKFQDEESETSGEQESMREDLAHMHADQDRALEEWKRLKPGWADEDSDSDDDEEEEEEEMACDHGSS
jgi:hypothetical protein